MTACVYILTNKKNGTLYIGVTSNLKQRIQKHKEHLIPGFTDRYDITRLVWYEVTSDIKSAIQREKHIKKWNRAWKIRLIEETNPEWRDLYDEL